MYSIAYIDLFVFFSVCKLSGGDHWCAGCRGAAMFVGPLNCIFTLALLCKNRVRGGGWRVAVEITFFSPLVEIVFGVPHVKKEEDKNKGCPCPPHLISLPPPSNRALGIVLILLTLRSFEIILSRLPCTLFDSHN